MSWKKEKPSLLLYLNTNSYYFIGSKGNSSSFLPLINAKSPTGYLSTDDQWDHEDNDPKFNISKNIELPIPSSRTKKVSKTAILDYPHLSKSSSDGNNIRNFASVKDRPL